MRYKIIRALSSELCQLHWQHFCLTQCSQYPHLEWWKGTYIISVAGSSVDHGVQIVTRVVWVWKRCNHTCNWYWIVHGKGNGEQLRGELTCRAGHDGSSWGPPTSRSTLWWMRKKIQDILKWYTPKLKFIWYVQVKMPGCVLTPYAPGEGDE